MTIPALPFTVTDWSQVAAELETELRDGRAFQFLPDMSYQVSDFGDAAHRSSAKAGAKLFMVD
jgi:hypothetical protein